MDENQFAKGSMLPKVQAAVKFAESKAGRTALITLLEKAKDGIEGKPVPGSISKNLPIARRASPPCGQCPIPAISTAKGCCRNFLSPGR